MDDVLFVLWMDVLFVIVIVVILPSLGYLSATCTSLFISSFTCTHTCTHLLALALRHFGVGWLVDCVCVRVGPGQVGELVMRVQISLKQTNNRLKSNFGS